MELLSINLKNFRNFTQKKIDLSPKLTVIIGPNGSGKTNILESALLLSGIRSHKVETDLDLIKLGKDEAKIEGEVFDLDIKSKLTMNMVIDDGRFVKKTYFVNSIKKRFIDFAAYLSVVVFEPADLELVAGTPSFRRHHLDSLLCQVDSDYWRNINAYQKIIARRNKLLVRILEGKAKKNELDFWDARLLEHGAIVSKKRHEFFGFLNFLAVAPITGPVTTFPPASARSTQKPVVDQKDQVELRAVGSPSSRATRKGQLGGFSWELKQSELNKEKLLKNRERDISAGITLSGPHRDDFRFMYKGHDLAFFGSRGEQRMAVLSLKLAELEFVSLKIKSRPVLALDDIFSELDWDHRKAVLSTVGKQQTIVTAAEVDSVPRQLIKEARIIQLG